MLKRKNAKKSSTALPKQQQPSIKTPNHLFVHLSVTRRWCDFALSCVFNLNIPVRLFYKNPLFFPKYDLLLQILSLITLQLTSLIKCEIVHRTVKNSLLPLSFIFHSLPYSEGQTKTLHWVLMSWETQEEQSTPVQYDEKASAIPTAAKEMSSF